MKKPFNFIGGVLVCMFATLTISACQNKSPETLIDFQKVIVLPYYDIGEYGIMHNNIIDACYLDFCLVDTSDSQYNESGINELLYSEYSSTAVDVVNQQIEYYFDTCMYDFLSEHFIFENPMEYTDTLRENLHWLSPMLNYALNDILTILGSYANYSTSYYNPTNDEEYRLLDNYDEIIALYYEEYNEIWAYFVDNIDSYAEEVYSDSYIYCNTEEEIECLKVICGVFVGSVGYWSDSDNINKWGELRDVTYYAGESNGTNSGNNGNNGSNGDGGDNGNDGNNNNGNNNDNAELKQKVIDYIYADVAGACAGALFGPWGAMAIGSIMSGLVALSWD